MKQLFQFSLNEVFIDCNSLKPSSFKKGLGYTERKCYLNLIKVSYVKILFNITESTESDYQDYKEKKRKKDKKI